MRQAVPLLSNREVEQLRSGKAISTLHPWATNDQQMIEDHLRHICNSIVKETGADSKVEWDHYGSGYASFVDVWFYRRTHDFRLENPLGHGEQYKGLGVLLSRLSPYYVFMEGEKSWDSRGGGSYLPCFEMLDAIQCTGVILLGQQVQTILENNGFVRAFKSQLSQPLPPGIEIETNLSSGELTQFDAMFNWYD